MFRIKYIEDNLIFTTDGEVYAYYEMSEYNNAFITPEQKVRISDDFELLIGQCNAPDIHMLQIATESDFRSIQDKAKEEIAGNLEEFAEYLIDKQTEVLVKKYGERQVKYRHYMGFRLMLTKEEVSIRGSLLDMKTDFVNFLGSVRHQAMNDYLVIDKHEIARYQAMERMLYNKISRHFAFRKVTPDDYGYIIEHIYGMQGVSYEDYRMSVESVDLGKTKVVRKYDYLNLSSALLHERQRCIEIERNEGTIHAAYFSVSTIISDLSFPDSEILYNQQFGLSFPVDTSIKVEAVDNRKAIKDTRNVIMEMDDLMKHAVKNGNRPEDDVLEASDSAEELKTQLKRTREKMYKVSYLVRVWGSSREELQQRCIEVKDFYDGYDVKLVRPFGNMADLHNEFLPAGKRAMDDYVQPVRSDFLSVLGFGATTKLGDGYGIYFGKNRISGAPVYIRPWLAAQEKTETKTNSLAALFSGATGWGKSVSSNLLLYYIALYGNRVVILDPKSERGAWKENFPELKDEINIINLTSDEKNRGMLDPYLILDDINASEDLAVDVLTYLTGISPSDGDRFPVLHAAIHAVSMRKERGLLLVIEELRKGDQTARKIADHIQGFANYSFAKLMFSDGRVDQVNFQFNKALNILQIADLCLPDIEKSAEEYSSNEKLSVASMLVIGNFGLKFVTSDRSVFKVFAIDEAWAMLGTGQGKSLQNKCVRMGRSMNSAMYFMSQGVDDVGGKSMKNNLGMKFAFHSDDEEEIERILTFFGLDQKAEGLKKIIRNLKIGECLFSDIWGHVGILGVDLVFREFLTGFDTTPGRKKVTEQETERGNAVVREDQKP